MSSSDRPKAKVVVGLEADDADLDRCANAARTARITQWRLEIHVNDAPQLHLTRRPTVITYVPGTRNLDSDFFRARFR